MGKEKTAKKLGLNPVMNGPEINTGRRTEVIDFVAGGFLPPLKDDFDEVMAKVRADALNASEEGSIGVEEAKWLEDTLYTVHKHRRKNRNIGLAILGGLSLLFGVSTCSKNKKIRDLKKQIEAQPVDWFGDGAKQRVKITKF